ncbi:MAG: hypothetical protein ACE5R3_03365 [Nitrosopumilaceae archaeon]
MKFFILFSILILFTAPAYAEALSISSDKSEYFKGDTITVSGQVDFDPDIPSVIIQILTPTKDNFAGIANVFPNPNGSFSTTFHAGGPTWPSDGVYTVKASYGGTTETTFDFFETPQTKQSTSNKESTDSQNNLSETISNEQPQLIPSSTQEINQKPKTHIPGFPALDKSPQYYIDRYNSEPDYESWFDSQFPGQSIESVVGYSATHVPNFPSLDKSPQYYIDRYNSEPDYESWFDSQFLGQSIYEVLGFPDPVQVPNWIKITAEWWSTGKIRDSDFLDGIEFMIKNNILVVPYLSEPDAIPDQDVPDWIRNTASWWAQDKISEDEFLNAIGFLIQNGIIIV